MPSKSMPQKRKPDITERYKAGTYKPMHIRDIVTKNWFFGRMQAFWNANKTNNALKIGKENEMLIVVDTSLLPLSRYVKAYPENNFF